MKLLFNPPSPTGLLHGAMIPPAVETAATQTMSAQRETKLLDGATVPPAVETAATETMSAQRETKIIPRRLKPSLVKQCPRNARLSTPAVETARKSNNVRATRD